MRNNVLQRLYEIITERDENPKPESYTCKLLANPELLRKKIEEEAREITRASREGKLEDKHGIVYEAGDLIYHTWVLLRHHKISPEQVYKELERRMNE